MSELSKLVNQLFLFFLKFNNFFNSKNIILIKEFQGCLNFDKSFSYCSGL